MCCTVSTFLQSLSCLTQNARVELRIYRQEMTFILMGYMNPGNASLNSCEKSRIQGVILYKIAECFKCVPICSVENDSDNIQYIEFLLLCLDTVFVSLLS